MWKYFLSFSQLGPRDLGQVFPLLTFNCCLPEGCCAKLTRALVPTDLASKCLLSGGREHEMGTIGLSGSSERTLGVVLSFGVNFPY